MRVFKALRSPGLITCLIAGFISLCVPVRQDNPG